MRASTPEEIERLFPEYMRRGNLDGALALYEPTFAFYRREGRVNVGIEALREELAPLADKQVEFQFTQRRVARAGDLALIYDGWRVISPREMAGPPIEVVWRQTDKSWTFAAGDPFAARGSAS